MIRSFIAGRLFVPVFWIMVGLMALAGFIESNDMASIVIWPLMVMVQAYFYRLDMKFHSYNSGKLRW